MDPLDEKTKRTTQEQNWEYWGRRIGSWLPYATLAAALVLALLQPAQSGRARIEMTLLAALAAGWVFFLYTHAPVKIRAHPLRMPVFYAGFLGLSAALMARQPIFFLFAASGFFYASGLRPWPLAFLGVGLTSTLINTLITGFPWPERSSWFFFGSLIVFQTLAIGFGNLLTERLGSLSEQRRQAVARLETALEENAGLQAQLVAQAREAGILEERQRLAREIHDTLAQGLTGIITQLGAAQGARDNPQRQQQHVENALTLARESLGEARRSVHALRPAPLDRAQLPDALADAARRWSQVQGVQANMITTGEPAALGADAEAALLRVAQEALANIARHASATRVGITLSYMDDIAALDIRDDGVGFGADAAANEAGEGFGLESMRQRITQVGGTLAIESEPGYGTAISARVPIRPIEQEQAQT